jgi:hypothetical protein
VTCESLCRIRGEQEQVCGEEWAELLACKATLDADDWQCDPDARFTSSMYSFSDSGDAACGAQLKAYEECSSTSGFLI